MGLSPVKDAWQHIFGKNTILACDSQIASVPLGLNVFLLKNKKYENRIGFAMDLILLLLLF